VVSSTKVTCSSSGTWVGDLDCPEILLQSSASNPKEEGPSVPQKPPGSDPNSCIPVNEIQNGMIDGSCKDPKKGDVCSIKCLQGFTLIGSEKLTCRGGSWDTRIPDCISSGGGSEACRPLDTPGNGSLTGFCKSPQMGLKCSLNCDVGFHPVGETPFTCTSKGWTNQDPRCVEITCERIPSLENGYLVGDCDPGVAGNFCAFTCNRGFALVGPSVTICSYMGRWEPTERSSCIPLSACNVKLPEKNNPSSYIPGNVSESSSTTPSTTITSSPSKGMQIQAKNNVPLTPAIPAAQMSYFPSQQTSGTKVDSLSSSANFTTIHSSELTSQSWMFISKASTKYNN